jgi:hypothetical protein
MGEGNSTGRRKRRAGGRTKEKGKHERRQKEAKTDEERRSSKGSGVQKEKGRKEEGESKRRLKAKDGIVLPLGWVCVNGTSGPMQLKETGEEKSGRARRSRGREGQAASP